MDYYTNTPSNSGYLKASENANIKNVPKGKWQPQHVAFYKSEKEELSDPVMVDQVFRITQPCLSTLLHSKWTLSAKPFSASWAKLPQHVSSLLICRHWPISCDSLQRWSPFPRPLLVLAACFLFWCSLTRLCLFWPRCPVHTAGLIFLTCQSQLEL